MQQEYSKKYKSYKLSPPFPTFREFCFPKQYSIQKPQAFIGAVMRPEEKIPSLLVLHKAGAGKTCAAIQVLNKYRGGRVRPVIAMPSSLIPGFYAELRSPCSEHPYLTVERRRQLAAGGAAARAAKREMREEIDAAIEILSFNGLAKREGPVPEICIIDEVQEVLGGGSLYRDISRVLEEFRGTKKILMSATPITDDVAAELPRLCALLGFEGNNLEDFANALQNGKAAVSYYRGAPPYTFPKVLRRHINVEFSAYQREKYLLSVLKEEKTPDCFYSQTRQRANAVVPNGVSAMTSYQLGTGLARYSAKFAEWIRRVSKGGLHFTFCEYTGNGGIALLTRILKEAGWKNYFSHGAGPLRYVKWTGEQTAAQKDKIREVFNDPSNDSARVIKLIIGSSAMKTGVSLLRVRAMHILEMHWNMSYLEQVEGRCVRYCSAKSLPREKREVKIYYYLGWTGKDRTPTPQNSIDAYMLSRAEEKQVAINEFVAVAKKYAIDRGLFQ